MHPRTQDPEWWQKWGVKVPGVLGGCEVGKGGIQDDSESLRSHGLGPRQHLLF